MKLQSLEIVGLHGSDQTIKLDFNADLNIITGKNGAGKTTILKLIWYVISGNIDIALKEIDFKEINITTDIYACNVKKFAVNNCEVTLSDMNDKKHYIDEVEVLEEEDGVIHHMVTHVAEDITNSELRKLGSSLFLPTFRRIEGRFTAEKRSMQFLIGHKNKGSFELLEEALIAIKEELSQTNHEFVASLSTKDIESMLIRKHSDISEELNKIQSDFSNETLKRIKSVNNGFNDEQSAKIILQQFQEKMENVEEQRKEKLKPFDVLKESVLKFIQHDGVEFSKQNTFINIGNMANAINSDLLSAGEKQMLSFIAYNTFYENTIFIIDEPELSLHVDWQRQLLPTLLKQGTSNQFIISTHSPFIYSKYPDKELQLLADKGNTDKVGE